MKMIYWRSL